MPKNGNDEGGIIMIRTLDDFIREYTKICDMGWVRTHRLGPTGIGKTLEDLLGIVENNIDGPDFGDYELKSCRLNSTSMLTIFTKTPQPQGAANTLRMTFAGQLHPIIYAWILHLDSLPFEWQLVLCILIFSQKYCVVKLHSVQPLTLEKRSFDSKKLFHYYDKNSCFALFITSA